LIDLKKAFDTVKRARLIEIIQRRKLLEGRDIQLLKIILSQTTIYFDKEHKGIEVN